LRFNQILKIFNFQRIKLVTIKYSSRYDLGNAIGKIGRSFSHFGNIPEVIIVFVSQIDGEKIEVDLVKVNKKKQLSKGSKPPINVSVTLSIIEWLMLFCSTEIVGSKGSFMQLKKDIGLRIMEKIKEESEALQKELIPCMDLFGHIGHSLFP